MATYHTHNNIRKYRKPFHINLGFLIFSAILIYILVYIYIYFTTTQIAAHEVKMGTLTTDTRYKGFIVRDESIITSNNDGYINFYVRDGERIGVNNLVYTIDESGTLYNYLNEEYASESALSTTDLNQLKSEIQSFTSTFDYKSYSKIYDFEYDLSGMILKYSNESLLEYINTLSASNISQSLNKSYATQTGIITFHTDGYEMFSEDQLTPELFDQTLYEKQIVLNNDLIVKGDPVYKVLTNENWCIYIPINEETASILEDETYIQIRFLDTQQISWAGTSVIRKDGDIYCKLDLNNSMIQFASQRFIDIELIMEENTGFKIPNSAIAEMEFYLVPKEYVTIGGESGNRVVLKETYNESGVQEIESVSISVYQETDTEYYIDSISLSIGDYLIMPNSTEKYVISKQGSLIGVYNMNKGYADFNQITILYENDEYSIVESNTKYGLSVYDYIVLDANSVNDDDFIY